MSEIEDSLSEIRALSKSKQFNDALAVCENLVSEHPKECFGYRAKADVLQLMGDHSEALVAREEVAKLGSEEPSDYYDLARLCFSMGRNEECIRWADRALLLSKKHDSDYYMQASHFFKANALLNINSFQEVLDICAFLEDGYGTFISGKGMVTKEDIVRSATEGKGRTQEKSWTFDD